MGDVWPLVGRSEELECVLAALEGSRGVVVAGAAGVGKSRLVAEAIARVEAAGNRVVTRVASRSARTVPLAAMTPMLAEFGIGPDDPARVLYATRRRIEQRHDVVVVAVDDAHLLDHASATLVEQLARTDGVSLLVAQRSGAAAPDAVDALWKEDLLVRIELQALSRADVRALLEDTLGGSVGDLTLELLFEASAGNALMLRELLFDARESGELVQRGGLWRWSGNIGAGPRLSALVAARLERIDEHARRLLELVALLEPLPVAIVERVVPLDVLERAERVGLLSVGSEGVRLGHPLYADVVWARLPATTRCAHVRALDTALDGAATELTETQLMRLALLHAETGEPASEALLMTGARAAFKRADAALAERLARVALDVRSESFEAAYLLAEALVAQGRFDDANAVAAAIEGREPDDAARVRLAHFRMLREVLLPGGSAERASAVVADAIGRVSAGPHRDYLTATAAELAMNRRDLGAAIALTDSLLERSGLDERTTVLAAHIASLSKSMSGRPESGRLVYACVTPPSRVCTETTPRAEAWSVLDQLLALTYAGRLVEAIDLCEAKRADRCDTAVGYQAELHHYQGRAELARGRPEHAAASLRQAVAELGVVDIAGYLAWSLGLLAATHALVGLHADAAEMWAQSERAAQLSARRLFDADRLLAGAWVMAGRGELSAAASLCARLGVASAEAGMTGWAVIALHDAVRLGDAGAARALQEVAASCEGALASAASAHASAVISGTGEELARSAEHLLAADMVLSAAEAYLQASSAYARAGRRAPAAAAAARGRLLAGECEGARTPILATVSAYSAGLTRREHEIAELAARGASNHEIAERLFVSVRTAEGHLLRAFAKLGITSREQLPVALGLVADVE